MAGRVVEIQFLGSTAQLEASLERAGLVAKGSGDAIGDAFNSGSSKAGNALEKLGKKGEQLGIPFAAGLTTAGHHLDEATTKTSKLTTALGEMGKATLLAGGAGLAAVGVEAVKLGTQYESAQAKIQAATGQSAKSAELLTHAFGGTAGKFEQSGMQMEGAYSGVAAQLKLTEGHALSTGEALKFQASATTLADGAGESLVSTTETLASVMQAFHQPVSQAAASSDELFNVSKALDVPLTQVGTAADKLHSKLGQLAPSFAETGGLMVALGEHGVQGSKGLQVVNTAFQTLVGGSEKTDAVLKDLGVNIFNSQGKFIGLQNVIAQLQPKLQGLTQQEQLYAEKTLFGAGASQVMGQVVQSGVGAFQKATEAATKSGTAHAAAAKNMETLKGEAEALGASIKTLGGDLGLFLTPELKLAGKALVEGIQWMEKHKAVAYALGGVITGVLGAAVSIYATQKAKQFITGTQEMITGMGKLASSVEQGAASIISRFTAQGAAAEGAAATTATADATMTTSTEAAAGTMDASLLSIRSAYGLEATAAEGAATANAAAGASFAAMVPEIALASVALVEFIKHFKEVNELADAPGKLVQKLMGGPEASRKEEEGIGIGTANPALKGVGGSAGPGSGMVGALEKEGLSTNAAQGVVAAYGAEGGTNTAEDPKEGAYGKAQWVGPRKEALERFAASKHESMSSEKAQLEFTAKEVKERGELGTLNKAKSPKEAADLFIKNFERPENDAVVEGRVKAPGSNSGLAGLMSETAGGKAAEKSKEKAESAAEKKASKAADAVEKAAKAHEAYLAKITTSGESLLKKYEGNVQNATASALEKSLGVSTTGKFKSIPGLTEAAAATDAIGGKGLSPLTAGLGKSASASVAGKQESQLVASLRATHQKGLIELASKVSAARKQALDTLTQEMVATTSIKDAEGLKLQATQLKDMNTLTEHAAAAQLTVMKDQQQQQTDAAKAAATATEDATQQMSDSFSALAQSVEDATKVMSDASNAAVAEVKDKTTVEVGILGERGLYGLNLIAQKLEVQLDQEKAVFDQEIIAAQTAQDQLKAQWQGIVAADQQAVDIIQTNAHVAEAAAQAHADSISIVEAQAVAAQQNTLDSVELGQDVNVALAQTASTLSANASKAQQDIATAALKRSEGAREHTDAAAEAKLKGAEAGANKANQEAQGALAATTSFWEQAIANAQAAVARAQGESSVALARSAEGLAAIEGSAARAEAAKEREVSVEKEKAQTQYAGSGLSINQYGIDFGNATAAANEAVWALTHQLPI